MFVIDQSVGVRLSGEDYQPVYKFGLPGPGTAPAYSPDGAEVIVGRGIVDAQSGELLREFQDHTTALRLWSPDGEMIGVSGRLSGQAAIEFHRSDTLDLVRSITTQQRDPFFVFSPDSSKVIYRLKEKVVIQSVTDGVVVREIPLRLGIGFSTRSVGISPDGKLLVVSDGAGGALAFNPDTGQSLPGFEVFPEPTSFETPTPAVFAADGQRLFAGGRIWDVPSRATIGFYDAEGEGLSVAPDGSVVTGRLATFSPDSRWVVYQEGLRAFKWLSPGVSRGLWIQGVATRTIGSSAIPDYVGDLKKIPIRLKILSSDGRRVLADELTYPREDGLFNFALPDLRWEYMVIQVRQGSWVSIPPKVTFPKAEIQSGQTSDYRFASGDIDGDYEVTIFDYIALSAAFGTSEGEPGYDILSDLDGDRHVTIFDYQIFSHFFGFSGRD